MTRIAINGLGRMGKLVLRDLIDNGAPGEIVLLNDPVGNAEQHAHLLEWDTVHGRWPAEFSAGEDSITINGQEMKLTGSWTLDALPLEELGIDMVIDCTGAFKTNEKLAPYYAAGVKKVIVSAPVKEENA